MPVAQLGPLRLFGSGDTVEEFSYEVINGGATLYSANYVNALASRLPNGTRIFERSIRVSMSPVIINREEIETVNVWATLGVIGESCAMRADDVALARLLQ